MRYGIILILLILQSPLAQFHTGSTNSTSTPIQHVILIMQENHSFDSYFGTYPTANGTLVDSTTTRLQQVNGIPDHVCLDYLSGCISPTLSESQSPSDPVEGQQTYEMDYSHNASGFATNSGPQSMTYFDYHTISAYWDYAEKYGLADNYFSAALATTTPNRLLTLSGDSPVSANYGPPPYISYNETVMHQLDTVGVSWGYYDYIDAFGGASNLYPLNFTSGMPANSLSSVRSIDDLSHELALGSGLPAVSFVNALGHSEFDEHPPFNPTIGEQWVVSMVDQVMSSSYWPTSAIFITWDEGGGYYDHVVPPYSFTINHNFTQPLIGLGQRVPLLVISPFARQNFVSHDLLSHLSLLHFIDYNWNLVPLSSLVSQSSLPLSFFNFTQIPRAPIILSPLAPYPVPLNPQPAQPPPSILIPEGLLIAGLVAVAVLVAWRSKLLRKKQAHWNHEKKYD